MNSTELVNVLSKKLQLPKADTAKRLEDAISVITDELMKNNIVSLLNLGSLEVQKRDERVCVVNGKKVLVPPKLIVKFKTSSTLKEKLKGLKL